MSYCWAQSFLSKEPTFLVNTGADSCMPALALVQKLATLSLTHLDELREGNEMLLKNNEIFMTIFQVLNFFHHHKFQLSQKQFQHLYSVMFYRALTLFGPLSTLLIFVFIRTSSLSLLIGTFFSQKLFLLQSFCLTIRYF